MSSKEVSRKKKRDKDKVDLVEKLVHVNRVAKVVKGGRRFAFAALMVVGDGKGKIGFASAKAKEVPDAVVKATNSAKNNMIHIPLKENRTLHHDVVAKFGAGYVVMRSAKPGTGVIAGGAMRAVFEALGIQDVVAKSIGSTNPHNLIRATLVGLQSSLSPKNIALKRGKKVSDILSRRSIVLGNSSENEVENQIEA
jgi:small subunit ribosomal protein S5